MSDSWTKRFEKVVVLLQADRYAPKRPTKPFERLWYWGTLVYFAGVLVVLYAYSRSEWGWNMPERLPLAAFAPFLGSFGLLAIYTGEVRFRQNVYVRSKTPVAYWAWVSVELFIGVGLFLVGIGDIGY